MNGLNFKKYRKDLGLSQESLGKSLFVSKRTIVNYEKSEKVPEDKVQLMLSIYSPGKKENEIEKIYSDYMDFKKSIEIIKKKGFSAYEIHKKTGLNEAGIRRVLNNEIENPQRKTKEGIIQFVSDHVEITPQESSVNTGSFNDLKIDDKLNIIFNELQELKSDRKLISWIQEEVELNNKIIAKTDRALTMYNENLQEILKEIKEDRGNVRKLS